MKQERKKVDFMKAALNYPAVPKSVGIGFAIATILIGLAFVTRLCLDNVLEGALPYVFFLTSAVIAAWFGGWMPGVYALAAGVLLGDLFFHGEIGKLDLYNSIEFISVIVPSLVAIVGIELFHRAARKQFQTACELRETQSRLRAYADVLEVRVFERTRELENSIGFFESFCHTIAHTLRAPARAIQGFMEILKEDYEPRLDHQAMDYVNKTMAAARKMDRLMNSLLVYGWLSHVKLSFERCAIRDYVTSAIEKLKKELPNSSVVEASAAPAYVSADARLLHLIFLHLIRNALLHARNDRELKISIWTETAANLVRCNVSDNGIGLDANHQKNMFSLFDNLKRSEGNGTGADLAIAAKAVERMGGKIGAVSTVSGGSTFWFDLTTNHADMSEPASPQTARGPSHVQSESFREVGEPVHFK